MEGKIKSNKYKLIYNHNAGGGRFKNFLDNVIEKFMQYGKEVSICRLDENTNVCDFVTNIKKGEYEGIIVAGGDGTINRLVNVVIKNDIDIPIGIIPAGTSNDFAKHLQMPIDFTTCVEKILAGNVQLIDVGIVNDERYFVNICSAGLFTNAPQRADKNLKKLIGNASYIVSAANQALKFKPFKAIVEMNGKKIEKNLNLFLIFNGSSVGGFDKFTQNSDIQDGVFDVVMVEECSLFQATKILYHILFTGKHFENKYVFYEKCNQIKVSKLKGKIDEPDVDGEAGLKFPIEVKCIPNKLKIFL